MPVMKPEKHHIQRAAERAAEAELNRRGISTAQTDANEPGIDLVAIHSKARTIPIEVKGKTKRGEWLIAEPKNGRTVYILVYVPTDCLNKPGAFRFFIMTTKEVRNAQDKYKKRRENLRRQGKPRKRWIPAILWIDADPHENRWNKLKVGEAPN